MRLLVSLITFILPFFAMAQHKDKIPAKNMSVAPSAISFVENKNQWHPSIRFKAEIPSGFIDVQNGALQYLLYDAKALHARHHFDETHPHEEPTRAFDVAYHSYTMEFVGANPVQAKSSEITPTIHNYYLGDKQFWADKARAYHKVSFEGLYPNIDYHLYSTHKTLKYEFQLGVGANPALIRMKYTHAQNVVLLPDGNLKIETSVGSIYDKKPISYQFIKGEKVQVPTKFVLEGTEVGFAFPNGYDKRYPILIDPDLIFSTYSGATSSNYGNTATFDNDGNLYSGSTSFGTGIRAGSPTPTNVGVAGGGTDIRLYKYNATGTTLLYLTFVGGSNTEVPHSLVTDGGKLLAFGATGSANFPTTFGPTFQGGTSASVTAATYSSGTDMYIVKLNANGTLDRARLLGGAGNEAIKPSSLAWTIDNYGDGSRGDIYVADNADVLVATNTTSTSIAGITGTLQGGQDALLLRFDNNLNLIFGKYFGGNGLDLALSVKINTAGDIFIGGGTRSTNLPASTGSVNSSLLGDDDGFIAKFDPVGNLIRSTYLGTSNADMAFFIDTDLSGDVYAYGQSLNAVYPIFPLTPTPPYNNGNSGQFIHKLNANLTSTIWSTRIGNGNGTYNLSPTAFLVDNCGDIFIAGYGGWSSIPAVTGSPVTPNAYKSSTDGRDFYLAVYKSNMQSLKYATFVGGTSSGEHVDGGTSRFSKDGIVYHAVCTSSGFSTSTGSWAAVTAASWDCAVFKFETAINADFTIQDPTIGTPISNGGTACSANLKFTFPPAVTEYDSFLWEISDIAGNILYTQSTTLNFNYTFLNAGDYRIRLVVTNCAKTAQSLQIIKVNVPNFTAPDTVRVCLSNKIELIARGAKTYTWSPAIGLSATNIPNPIASPTQTTVYTVVMKDDQCTVTKKVRVEVIPATAVNFQTELLKDCNTPYRVKLTLLNTDSTKFKNIRWEMGDGRILLGTNPPEFVYTENSRDYTITLVGTNLNDCETKLSKKITIPTPPIQPPNVITPNGDNVNDVFEIAEAGSKLQIWNRWGKSMFKSDNYKNDWGTSKEVLSGIYYYQLLSPSGTECKGWLQVMK